MTPSMTPLVFFWCLLQMISSMTLLVFPLFRWCLLAFILFGVTFTLFCWCLLAFIPFGVTFRSFILFCWCLLAFISFESPLDPLDQRSVFYWCQLQILYFIPLVSSCLYSFWCPLYILQFILLVLPLDPLVYSFCCHLYILTIFRWCLLAFISRFCRPETGCLRRQTSKHVQHSPRRQTSHTCHHRIERFSQI